jgi:putative spermidine/putrescine transport system permease protein
LFGFTLSFDEFARSLLAMGVKNSLPLELFGMTTTVTTPTLYALGTLTTLVSFLVIGLSFLGIHLLQRRRLQRQKGG